MERFQKQNPLILLLCHICRKKNVDTDATSSKYQLAWRAICCFASLTSHSKVLHSSGFGKNQILRFGGDVIAIRGTCQCNDFTWWDDDDLSCLVTTRAFHHLFHYLHLFLPYFVVVVVITCFSKLARLFQTLFRVYRPFFAKFHNQICHITLASSLH